MSKLIATRAIRGAHKIVARAEKELGEAIDKHGKDLKVAFPDTNYYLPFAYAMLAIKAKEAGDLLEILDYAKGLLPPIPSEHVWLPYLGPTLDAGMATLFAEEIIEVLKYSLGPSPTHDFWVGFTTDAIMREQGIKLVDGRMPGFAAIVGSTPTNKEAVKLIRELQERRILVFMSATTDGKCIAQQLAEEGVQMGWGTFLVPHGTDISSTIYALNLAVRAAITFGGITPKGMKEAKDILLYNKNRVHAFVLALGDVDDEKHANAAGAINFGFPAIADTDIEQILPTGICKYEHVVSPVPRDQMVNKAIEVRGLKITVEKIDIPVSYGPAFEGERVRREQTACEIGSKFSKALEVLRMKKLNEVEDGKIEVIGPELNTFPDDKISEIPYALVIDVAGRKMQHDFESVLERRVHTYLSEAMGVMHTGQRNMIWIRVSKEAKKAGLLFRHFGVIMHSKLLHDFPSIVDKVQVKIYTKQEDVEKLLHEAMQIYDQRDDRLAGLTDDAVDTFYSCKLCQSYAPNHVCIITPERLGLCGAYNWLDGKAASEMNPTGGNEPVLKGKPISESVGEWEGVNEYLYNKSNKAVERFGLYSIIEAPTTSCGCFECIAAVLPETNGIMIVNRGFSAMTPCGMKFTTLAGSVGGGNQTPGFSGIGRLYITSKKFFSNEGGIKRIVWMTKELKEMLGERLKKRCEEIGDPDFINKIADETIATTSEQLVEFLQKANHPALTMPPILEGAPVA